MKCAQADEDSAARLTSKQWRARYLCHVGEDDCIDSGEFVNLLSVGFGEAGEATIDAIAFDDPANLESNGYDNVRDQLCARLFIKLDRNEDRIL